MGALFAKRLGHEVEIVPGGHDAAEAFQRRLYHLILMDCEMLVLDGYEATRAIRQSEERTDGRIPILAVTANATPGARELRMAAGPADTRDTPSNAMSDNLPVIISGYLS